MKQMHEWLAARSSFYRNWDNSPPASVIANWAIFLAFALLASNTLLNDIGAGEFSINNTNLAASGQALPLKSQNIPGQYIVTFNDSVKDTRGLIKQIESEHGGKHLFTYTGALKGFAVANLPDQAVEALKKNPNVKMVESDMTLALSNTQSGATWGIARIDQRSQPLDTNYTYNNSGEGVTVYVLDTGIRYDHSEFYKSITDVTSRAVFGYDNIGDGRLGADCHGHGTHVAGTIGGLNYGVAKQTTLVSVRIIGCQGSGTVSGAIAGLDWIVNTHNSGVPAVANMSLGSNLNTSFNNAVKNVINDGVAVAVAAGNSTADACLYSPASLPEAITVGASGMTDAISSFSNYGNCVDIFAPGVSIVSAAYGGTTGTATWSGTSMASPHVAGAAALYLAAYPTSTPSQVHNGLSAMATPNIIANALSAKNNLLYTLDIGNGITPPPSNIQPVANFTQTCSDLTCNFTNQSTDSDGTINSWFWNFGDGYTSSSQNPIHTYNASGTYTVQLTVTDDDGSTSSTSHNVTVTSPASSPLSIDSYAVTTLTTTSATISWTTNIPSTGSITYSRVVKGKPEAPITVSDSTSGINHAIVLTGLIKGSNYTYTLNSLSGSETDTVSGTFKTRNR